MNESHIFLAALGQPAPADRAAYLDVACVGDPGLRADVEALLRAHDTDPEFLEQPVGPDTTPDSPRPAAEAARPGLVLAGRYTLAEPIGEGGMGTVWKAQQTEPVRRPVAVKLIKAGMDSKQVLARFEAERQALAVMDHPNIAKVLDGGPAPDGRPFFVMELVDGTPITRHCDDRRRTVRQRLELFAQVCQAVQHAHQKGVIHRDLKPSNVLVAEVDGKPVPKVIDFGVAKAAGEPLTEASLHTGLGTLVGTPEYMSPEQATFAHPDVDTRSDVYALGVLLYELLAGSPPVTRAGADGLGLLETFRVIREDEPARPSARLGAAGLPALAARRGTDPARLVRLVRGDLDWIVMTCLEKDRTRRYESAGALGRDVERYLADEPVSAGPPSRWYRAGKFVRRNRGAVLAAGALSLGLAGTAVAVGLAWRETATALAGERAARRDEAEQRVRTEAEQAAKLVLMARREWEDHRVDRAADFLADCPPAQRGPEWAYLDRMCRAEVTRIAVPAAADPRQVAFAPAGRYLAVGGKAGVWVWDLTSGELAFTAAADAGLQCWLSFSPDGRLLTRLARLTRPPRPAGPTSPQIPFPAPDKQPAAPTDYACATWEVPGGRPVESLRRPPLAGLGWANSAAGPFQAVIDRDRVRILNFRSGAVAEFAHGHRAADQLEISSGGRYLLTTGPNEPVKVWEVATGGLVHTNAPRPIRTGALAFRAEVLSPDGTRLLRLQRGSPGPVVEVWHVPGDRPVCAIPQAGPESLDGFRFNPNGRVLAATTSAAIRVWDTETGRETFVLRGHGKVVIDVAVSNDGTRLASVGLDGTVRVWDISNPR